MFYKTLLIPIISLAQVLPQSEQCIPQHINQNAPQGGTLRLAHMGSPTTFHPQPGHQSTYPGLDLVYEPLIEKTLQGAYVTLLAKSLIFSETSVSITLENACFSNQQKITAEDVVYSFQTLSTSPTHPLLQQLFQSVSFSKNEQGLLLNHNLPHEDLLLLLSTVPIVPKGHDLESPPIGSGPYLFKKKSGYTITYQRNPYYWGREHPQRIGRFNTDIVSFQSYPSHTSISKAFQHNHIDYYLEHSALNWQQVYDTDIHTYKTLPHPQQNYHQILWYNTDKQPLHDDRVRQAVHTIVDPHYLNTWLYQGYYHTPESSPINTPLRDKQIEASHLLDQANWIMQSDGFRYQHHQKLCLDIITPHPYFDPLLHCLKTQYRRIGIDLHIKQLSKAHYYTEKKNKQYHLIIEPLVLDKQNKSIVSIIEAYALPKIIVLLSHYHTAQPDIAYSLLTTLTAILQEQHMITPLWSINCFRVGYHKKLYFIHKDQSYIDIYSWWIE